MIKDVEAYIKEVTKPTVMNYLSGIMTYQATDLEGLWDDVNQKLGMQGRDVPPPFWAFSWAGGIGLARYLLDNPEVVKGKKVFDFASGSGLVAIAASKSGAKKLRACEIDPLAEVAMQMNADLNGVRYKNYGLVDLEKPMTGYDVILAGDVCYEPVTAHRIIKWLRLCALEGVEVLMGDPGRAYMPTEGMEMITEYVVPTCAATENVPTRNVQILRILGKY